MIQVLLQPSLHRRSHRFLHLRTGFWFIQRWKSQDHLTRSLGKRLQTVVKPENPFCHQRETEWDPGQPHWLHQEELRYVDGPLQCQPNILLHQIQANVLSLPVWSLDLLQHSGCGPNQKNQPWPDFLRSFGERNGTPANGYQSKEWSPRWNIRQTFLRSLCPTCSTMSWKPSISSFILPDTTRAGHGQLPLHPVPYDYVHIRALLCLTPTRAPQCLGHQQEAGVSSAVLCRAPPPLQTLAVHYYQGGHILKNNFWKTCLGALFIKNAEASSWYCDFQVQPADERVFQMKSNN